MRSVEVGKGPENWLLLRSSSVRYCSSLKESGTGPENLLLFRWRKDRWMSKESSFTSEPLRLAWLRSTPETTEGEEELSSGGSEQKTPLYEHTLGPTQEARIPLGSSVMADFQA